MGNNNKLYYARKHTHTIHEKNSEPNMAEGLFIAPNKGEAAKLALREWGGYIEQYKVIRVRFKDTGLVRSLLDAAADQMLKKNTKKKKKNLAKGEEVV